MTNIEKYMITMLIMLVVAFVSAIAYSTIPSNKPIVVEITYCDNSKEIITTCKHSRFNIAVLRGGCTVEIYDYSRCGVRSVKILKQ